MLCMLFCICSIHLFGDCRCLKSPNEHTFIVTLFKNLINNFLRFITLIRTIVDYYTTLYVLSQAIITKKYTTPCKKVFLQYDGLLGLYPNISALYLIYTY